MSVQRAITVMEEDRARRCFTCGKIARQRKDGRYGAHTIGQARYPCHGAGRRIPGDLRVLVRILYREPDTKSIGHAADVVRWDGPGHRTVEVAYDGGPLESYVTRFDQRDRDLIVVGWHAWPEYRGRRHTVWPKQYLFSELSEPVHGAWAAHVLFATPGVPGTASDPATSRTRQIEQAIGSAAAHDFALAS